MCQDTAKTLQSAVPRRYARAGPRVAAVLIQTEYLADALTTILDTSPPAPAVSNSASDPLAVARYAARPLALRVIREACQASAWATAAVHSSGALPDAVTVRDKCYRRWR